MAILDVRMAAQIRARRSAADLPIVILTSIGTRDIAPSGVDIAAYLTKPIKPSELYNVLTRILDRVPRHDAPAAGIGAATVLPGGTPDLRILVAEDNATNQHVARMLLAKIGYQPDVVNNGREAIAALERHPYDVILMDVEMPEMDGLEATRRIHARWPADQRPRIIAATANAMNDDRETYLAAGMDDYVSKPIRIAELAAAIARCRPRSSSTAPNLDADALDALRASLDDDAVAELLDVFLADSVDMPRRLAAAVRGGDWDEARRSAHSLKSNAATFGATALADACRALEHAVVAGAPDGTAALLAEVEAEYERARQALALTRKALVP